MKYGYLWTERSFVQAHLLEYNQAEFVFVGHMRMTVNQCLVDWSLVDWCLVDW